MFFPSLFFVVAISIHFNSVKGDEDLMRFMWSTPIITQNLMTKVVTESSLDAIQVSKLKADVKELYDLYQIHSANYQISEKDATDVDLFYRYQLEYRESRPQSFYTLLAKTFHKAILKYITEIHAETGMQLYTNLSDDEFNQKLFIWSSVHMNATSHQPHHHVNSAISGVFYVSVPRGSGDIVFNDPRGSLPPFGKTLRIKPVVGDLILFPGYLVHSVLPTMTSQPRISISFNLEGGWELTSDVNEGFYV